MSHDIHSWSPSMDRRLRKLSTEYIASEIAEMIGVPVASVRKRAAKNGITLKKRTRVFSRTIVVKSKTGTVFTSTSLVEREEKAEGVNPEYASAFVANMEVTTVSLVHVNSTQCRWPLDGNGKDGFPRCCGRETGGVVYCPDHTTLAMRSAHATTVHKPFG